MPKFFCDGEMGPFFFEYCEEIEAAHACAAAEIYAARIFDEEGCDRPVEVYVVTSRDAKSAMKYEVRRTVKITDRGCHLNDVDVPLPEEE